MATLVIGTAPALADEVDTLVAEGEALAKNSEFVAAIDRFKRADRITPKARHACMIGLTYLRLGMLPRTEVFLARCRARATATDPLPEWLDDAERQLREQLAAATVLAIDLRVLPASAAATVTVSSFGTDESFEPQKIHLPLGTHVISVRAPGFVSSERRVVVTESGTQAVEIVLAPEPVAAPVPAIVPVTPQLPVVVTAPDHTWSNRLLVGAGVAAAGGIVLHVLAFRTRHQLELAQDDPVVYRQHETTFDIERAATFTLYGIAAVAGGIGLYQRLTHREGTVGVGADVRSGTALVTVGWER